MLAKIKAAYQKKEEQVGSDMMRYLERMLMLQVVDSQWKDHLLAMDHLKEGIGLRGYGQKDPLIEYKREGFEMFEAMEARIATRHGGFSDEGPGCRGGRSARRTPRTCRRLPWCRTAMGGGDATRDDTDTDPAPLRRSGAGRGDEGQGGTKRSVSVRQREEVQEVLRGLTRVVALGREAWERERDRNGGERWASAHQLKAY